MATSKGSRAASGAAAATSAKRAGLRGRGGGGGGARESARLAAAAAAGVQPNYSFRDRNTIKRTEFLTYDKVRHSISRLAGAGRNTELLCKVGSLAVDDICKEPSICRASGLYTPCVHLNSALFVSTLCFRAFT